MYRYLVSWKCPSVETVRAMVAAHKALRGTFRLLAEDGRIGFALYPGERVGEHVEEFLATEIERRVHLAMLSL